MNAVCARDQVDSTFPQSSVRYKSEHCIESEKSGTQDPSKPYCVFGSSFLSIFFFAVGLATVRFRFPRACAQVFWRSSCDGFPKRPLLPQDDDLDCCAKSGLKAG